MTRKTLGALCLVLASGDRAKIAAALEAQLGPAGVRDPDGAPVAK